MASQLPARHALPSLGHEAEQQCVRQAFERQDSLAALVGVWPQLAPSPPLGRHALALQYPPSQALDVVQVGAHCEPAQASDGQSTAATWAHWPSAPQWDGAVWLPALQLSGRPQTLLPIG